MTLEEAMESVWRQALVEGKKEVSLPAEDGQAARGLETTTYLVRKTPKKGLREVDFEIEGRTLRGLEQNPNTKSRWAVLARKGHRVKQFLEEGRYVGVVVDGRVTLYGEGRRTGGHAGV